jgi:hypothetical protein
MIIRKPPPSFEDEIDRSTQESVVDEGNDVVGKGISGNGMRVDEVIGGSSDWTDGVVSG